MRIVTVAFCAGLVFISSGCATIRPRPDLRTSSPEAKSLLEASLTAHGKDAFENIRDVAVAYDGEWAGAVWVFQPILIDRDFRKRSEERILLPSLVTGQHHYGPGGEKHVYGTPQQVGVWYNGEENEEPLVNQAAAGVVDGYLMFLLGPFYFQLRDAVVAVDEPVTVNGHRCEQLVAVLRPGFGHSPEDRVLIAIDRETHLVRRLRFTFNALPSTRGVVADVLPSDHVWIDGVLWPTQFVEIIRNPLPNVTVHRWRVTGLDTNRGLTREELEGPEFSGKARMPAGNVTALVADSTSRASDVDTSGDL